MTISLSPEEWSPEEREEYKRAYAAGEPVLSPIASHEDGECDVCEILRQLRRDVDEGDE